MSLYPAPEESGFYGHVDKFNKFTRLVDISNSHYAQYYF